MIRIGGKVILIKQGDITAETTDAIVNPANSQLLHGGGAARAIAAKGGPVIEEQSRRLIERIGEVPTGKAVMTDAGGGEAFLQRRPVQLADGGVRDDGHGTAGKARGERRPRPGDQARADEDVVGALAQRDRHARRGAGVPGGIRMGHGNLGPAMAGHATPGPR